MIRVLVEIKESKSARGDSAVRRRLISMPSKLSPTEAVAKNATAEFVTSPPTYLLAVSRSAYETVRGPIITPVSSEIRGTVWSNEVAVGRGQAMCIQFMVHVHAREVCVEREERHGAQEAAPPFAVVVFIHLDDLVQRAEIYKCT